VVNAVVTHTAGLAPDELAEVRALCHASFDDYGDETWQHALGGMHALVRNDARTLVAHGSLVLRRMRVGDRWLRCGWVESVAVHPDHRRRGHGHAAMAALEALAPGYDLLGLCSSDDGRFLYEARGWTLWRGPASALTPDGIRSTPDEDSIYVLAGREVDPAGPIVCDWREGEVW
jgi:aminoglycoside 2'-N-acetyltransferase I